MKPRLLDLFCGAGGAAQGYANAGFEVVGVDILPQPNYPFEFHQADAIELLWGAFEADAIHTSPPCQDYSRAMRHLSSPQPRLIEPVRELLKSTRLPWVIENVPGAPLSTQSTLDGSHGLELCGTQFGLRVSRHRLFETSLALSPPVNGCRCDSVAILNPHRAKSRERIYHEFGRQDPEKLWLKEMGVEWMGRYEGREAIPPAYTEFIGRQLYAIVEMRKAA